MKFYFNKQAITHDIPFTHNGKTYLFQRSFNPYQLKFIGTIDGYHFEGEPRQMNPSQWNQFQNEAKFILNKLHSREKEGNLLQKG